MAARRIAQSSINWTAMAELVPENQKGFFNALKFKSDGYLRKVLANPESAPKIDFSSYKKKIAIPGLVDGLQKQYESFTVPYPSDKLSSEIDTQQRQSEQEVKAFIVESNKRIAENQAGIDKWGTILPFEEMTMEDYRDAFPDLALDPINRPTFWPHTPDEQLDYKPKDAIEH